VINLVMFINYCVYGKKIRLIHGYTPITSSQQSLSACSLLSKTVPRYLIDKITKRYKTSFRNVHRRSANVRRNQKEKSFFIHNSQTIRIGKYLYIEMTLLVSGNYYSVGTVTMCLYCYLLYYVQCALLSNSKSPKCSLNYK